MDSWWVNFEIEYFLELNKPLYIINLDNNGCDKYKKFKELKYNLKKYEIENIY